MAQPAPRLRHILGRGDLGTLFLIKIAVARAGEAGEEPNHPSPAITPQPVQAPSAAPCLPKPALFKKKGLQAPTTQDMARPGPRLRHILGREGLGIFFSIEIAVARAAGAGEEPNQPSPAIPPEPIQALQPLTTQDMARPWLGLRHILVRGDLGTVFFLQCGISLLYLVRV